MSVLDAHHDRLLDMTFDLLEVAHVAAGPEEEQWNAYIGMMRAGMATSPEDARAAIERTRILFQERRKILRILIEQHGFQGSLRTIDLHQLYKDFMPTECDSIASAIANEVARIFLNNLEEESPADLNVLAREARKKEGISTLVDLEDVLETYVVGYIYDKCVGR